MLHSRYPDQVCSVARALEVVGERWSLLIVRDALQGVRRFDEFQRSLGIARNVLTARLEHLVTEGVLERQPVGGHQRRRAYELTEKGRQLAVVVTALMNWGDRHYPAPGGPPRRLEHDHCGGPVEAGLICSLDGEHVTGPDLTILPGPGQPSP